MLKPLFFRTEPFLRGSGLEYKTEPFLAGKGSALLPFLESGVIRHLEPVTIYKV